MTTAAELYDRVKALNEQIQTDPDNTVAKAEFAQLQAFVESNATLKDEIAQLVAADAAKAPKAQTPVNATAGSNGDQIASEDLGTLEWMTEQAKMPQSLLRQRAKAAEAAGRPIVSTRPFNFDFTGQVVDFWSDLLEGYGDKESDLKLAFRRIMVDRHIAHLQIHNSYLHLPGWVSRKQYFERLQWYVAKAAFRTEQMGDDLYISWRVFVKEQVSRLRIFLWLSGCLLAAVFLTVGFNFQVYTQSYYGYGTNPYLQGTLETFLKVAVGTGIWLFVIGLFRYGGDPWALLRRPLDEFDRDDAMAAGHLVHKTLLQAADQIGIDSTTLAPHTPTWSVSPAKRRL